MQALPKHLDRKHCVVCGKKTAGYAGYIFYESGKTRLLPPFCREHFEKAAEYAMPVFENQAALDIFRQMFPVTYLKDVQGKPILFFDTHKTAN